MIQREIKSLIQQAADACQKRDAEAFANLFTQDGELIISQQSILGKTAIAQITADYLLTCEDIHITIEKITIEGEIALVKWYWEDTKTVTGKRKGNRNTIKIYFQSGLITRWHELEK